MIIEENEGKIHYHDSSCCATVSRSRCLGQESRPEVECEESGASQFNIYVRQEHNCPELYGLMSHRNTERILLAIKEIYRVAFMPDGNYMYPTVANQ